MLTLKQIRQIHVEITTRCNARCPMCMRNYRGYDYNSGYPICELSLAQFKHIFSPSVLAGLLADDPPENGRVPKWFGFRGITFNGNLGDFGNASDGAEIVEYLAEHHIPVTVNTNGSLRSPEWWARLAHANVTVGFAIDGLADTHHLYRQDTDWHKIIRNAESFIQAGGQAVWRFVPFDHNQHQEQACRELAHKMGFEDFVNIYDGRDSTPVFTRQGEYSHQIGTDVRPAHIVPEVTPMLENHVTWYDRSRVNLDQDRADMTIQCLHQRNREIYVAADGSVYPCCYLGFYPGQMHHPGNVELAPLVKENNALEYDLDHCLNWFEQVESTWSHSSIATGRLYQCVKHCGKI